MRRSMAGPATLPILLLISMALVSACGGGSAVSPADPDATGGAGDSPAATEAPAPTEPAGASEPAAEPPAASDPTSGGPAGPVCDLATADEVGGVFGATVTLATIPGVDQTCVVETAEGRTILSWTRGDVDAQMTYDLLTVGATPADGLGDRAAFVENLGLLILKGDTLVTVTVAGGADLDEDAAADAARQVGGFIAGRM